MITKDEGALFYPASVLQTAVQRTRVIRSSMFLNEKFFATREFEKIKAGLVAGGEQQNNNLCDDLSAPTVSTGSVFTLYHSQHTNDAKLQWWTSEEHS